MTTRRQKATFTNAEGHELAALLELPTGNPRAWALFAHCFTCGKDIAAATRVCRALAARGFATLRFDFTGLGGSDGDFSNTHFSSNIEDLVSAANWLREHHQAPSLLIGHSLGGTAVLAATQQIPEASAVATIAAPSDPAHVTRHFGEHLGTVREEGEAEVDLAGRSFCIKREFLDDLKNHRMDQVLEQLDRPLLVFHSPVDTVVSINEAARIYQQARHPKSFVSLDDADHLLTRKPDADYVAAILAAWAQRYLPGTGGGAEKRRAREGEVEVFEHDRNFLRDIFTDQHFLQADEPEAAGGSNAGPDPYELLLASLGSCTSMTIRMYANHKKWPLEDVRVRLEHDRVYEDDCRDCDEEKNRADVIYRHITLEGNLDDKQRERLIEIADRCPVHKTLLNLAEIKTREER